MEAKPICREYIDKKVKKINTAYNFSYPSSAAPVVFDRHLSARAAFRLDKKSPAIRYGLYRHPLAFFYITVSFYLPLPAG
jgi:hypothetical protein